MHSALHRAAGMAAVAVDRVIALRSAWPRSASARELARLVREEGHAPGEACDLAFSLSFEDAERAAAAAMYARRVGCAVDDVAGASRGFLTVSIPVRLVAYDLAHAVARLRRVARRHGGFAELIGPARPAMVEGVGMRPRRAS